MSKPVDSFRSSHVDAQGDAKMVDVGGKLATDRRARASARVRMAPDALARLLSDSPKGDVLAVARIAAIQAAKQTPHLIPLCHQIALTKVDIDFDIRLTQGEIGILATARALDRTGVEMEAMVAASIAALALYDMGKSIDRWMVIDQVRLEEKAGGKSGTVVRGSE